MVIDAINSSDLNQSSGWGLLEFGGMKSNTLQKVKLNVITLAKCKQNYPDVSDSNICTFTPGKDTCQVNKIAFLFIVNLIAMTNLYKI